MFEHRGCTCWRGGGAVVDRGRAAAVPLAVRPLSGPAPGWARGLETYRKFSPAGGPAPCPAPVGFRSIGERWLQMTDDGPGPDLLYAIPCMKDWRY